MSYYCCDWINKDMKIWLKDTGSQILIKYLLTPSLFTIHYSFMTTANKIVKMHWAYSDVPTQTAFD